MLPRQVSLLLRGSVLQSGCQQAAGIAQLAAAAPCAMLHAINSKVAFVQWSSSSSWSSYSTTSSSSNDTAGGSSADVGSVASAAGTEASTQQQQQQQQQQQDAAPPAQRQQWQQQPPPAAAAAYGPRKITPRSGQVSAGAGPAKREGIVHVNSTFNNTIMVLTDRDSNVQTWTSGGTVGYKNANKATPMAAELAAKELAKRAVGLGFHSVVVKLKGMGKNKQFAVQSLAASGLTVTQLQDVTPIPYNGCRLPRRRRV